MTNEAATDVVVSPTSTASDSQVVADKSKINPLDGDEVKSVSIENGRVPFNNNGNDGHIDQSNGAEQQPKSGGVISSSASSSSSDAKGRGRALEFAPTVMSAVKDTAEPSIFVTAPPPLHGGLAVIQGKSLKDLTDVSMDETEESIENESREKTEHVKKDRKECKKVSELLLIKKNKKIYF